MKPNEIITPDIVRWVLGIGESSVLSVGETIFYKDMQTMDIHRFIYLAIEKCAAEGWTITPHITSLNKKGLGSMGVQKNREDGSFQSSQFSWGRHERGHYKFENYLHAQLAAIAWVYDKIQEGK